MAAKCAINDLWRLDIYAFSLSKEASFVTPKIPVGDRLIGHDVVTSQHVTTVAHSEPG